MNRKIEPRDFRAAYHAAGPNVDVYLAEAYAPIPMNREKAAAAAGEESVRKLAEANINYLIVPFDLGLPPETSAEQHEYFKSISETAAAAGVQTIAMIASSTYIGMESFEDAAWCAMSPKGKPIRYSYYADGYIACWSNEEWQSRLSSLAGLALDAGAAGVMLDFVCFGAAPMLISDKLNGPAGCHCRTCRRKFAEEQGLTFDSKKNPIPNVPNPADVKFREYTRWRCSIVTDVFKKIRLRIDDARKDALLCLIAPHAAYLPSDMMFGLDPAAVMNVVDVFCLEHHKEASLDAGGLSYESPGVKLLSAMSGGALVASLSYRYGPCTDAPPSAARMTASVCGVLASGGAPVIRSGEYKGGGDSFGDFLTSGDYSDQTLKMAEVFNWMDKNYEYFEDLEPESRIALVYSHSAAERAPGSFYSSFYKIQHTLIETQTPPRIVAIVNMSERPLDGINILIVPEIANVALESTKAAILNGKKIFYSGEAPTNPIWSSADLTRIDPAFFNSAEGKEKGFPRGKAGLWLLRRMFGRMDYLGGFPLSRRAGMPPPLLCDIDTMNYRYLPPPGWKLLTEPVRAALSEYHAAVSFEGPPNIHVSEWSNETNSIFHIVNILPEFKGNDALALRFASPVSAKILDAATNKIVYQSNESTIVVKPQPYTVVVVRKPFAENT